MNFGKVDEVEFTQARQYVRDVELAVKVIRNALAQDYKGMSRLLQDVRTMVRFTKEKYELTDEMIMKYPHFPINCMPGRFQTAWRIING